MLLLVQVPPISQEDHTQVQGQEKEGRGGGDEVHTSTSDFGSKERRGSSGTVDDLQVACGLIGLGDEISTPLQSTSHSSLV